MDAKDIRIYEACDKAIQEMNRESLRDFGKLKLAKWDELNVIQTVSKVYTASARNARKKYYEVAFEAYVLAMTMCGEDAKDAHRKAEKAIDAEWVNEILERTDFVTLYRFDTEMERKAYRLAEALEVSNERDFEINKALRFWSQQLGQYAINMTDYAVLQAFADAGVEKVMWVSEHDNRVCNECHSYDGQVFEIDELPVKPHWGCRCHYIPVLD